MRLLKFIFWIFVCAALVYLSAFGLTRTRLGKILAEGYIESLSGTTVGVSDINIGFMTLEMHGISLGGSTATMGEPVMISGIVRAPSGFYFSGISGKIPSGVLDSSGSDSIEAFFDALENGENPFSKFLSEISLNGDIRVSDSSFDIVFGDGSVTLSDFSLNRNTIKVPGHRKAFRNTLSFKLTEKNGDRPAFGFASEWFEISGKQLPYSNAVSSNEQDKKCASESQSKNADAPADVNVQPTTNETPAAAVPETEIKEDAAGSEEKDNNAENSRESE